MIFLIAVLNFLSHWFIPQILMFSKQIKNFNTMNIVIVGAICLMIMVSNRFNEAANFCINPNGAEALFLVKRGRILWTYTNIVITMSSFFVAAISLFCVFNMMYLGL